MALPHGPRSNGETQPYLNLFARLSHHLPEYVFDSGAQPFHSSYDNWHVIGRARKSSKEESNSDLGTKESIPAGSSSSSTSIVDHVVARVTQNELRIEREFKQAQMLCSNDKDFIAHCLKPVRLVRMPAHRPGEVTLAVSVVEAPSLTYLEEMTFLKIPFEPDPTTRRSLPSLSTFLELAICTCGSLEVLHHRYGLVHGEIRMDAFHFDPNSSTARLINLGSGVRSFTSRLTSTGWTNFLSEVGVRYKLQFFAPEQTGRLAAEPDMRTDIYALGVGFWALLTGLMPFKGSEPLEIIQSVLSQHLPSVQSVRPEIPAPIAMVIAKMTKKAMTDRYNSISSAKHDLIAIRSLLTNGDVLALRSFKVAQDDISATFTLPTKLIGRETTVKIMTDTVESASEKMSLTIEHYAQHDLAARGSRESTETLQTTAFSAPCFAKKLRSSRRSAQDRGSFEVLRGQERSRSEDAHVPVLHPISDEPLTHMISLTGERGIGKTFLIRNMQQVLRRHALLASTQIEKTRTQPLDPILKLISAIFRQLFSESNVNSSSHAVIRQEVGPYWKSICAHLELPAWLLDTDRSSTDIFGKSSQRPKSWLDCAGISQTSRFMQVLLQVLRVVAFQKPLCLCLDDIDLVDQEGLDLMQALVDANLPILLIVLHKPYGPRAAQLVKFTESATKIELQPFTEENTYEYVTETLGYLGSNAHLFASVVYDRTGGIPSYTRDFLDRCHSSGIVAFSWETRRWEVKMDRAAKCWPFTNDLQKSVEMTIFSRFQKLPDEVQHILSWSAVGGFRISFAIIRAVSQVNEDTAAGMNIPLPINDALGSLQFAVSKFILRPTDHDDIFEFSDDNTYSACAMLADEYDLSQMHYMLAKTMLLSTGRDTVDAEEPIVFDVAEHVLNCLDVITARGDHHDDFLQSLLAAAGTSRARGALRKSAAYCDAAMRLVGPEPWSALHTQLYTRAAEVYHLVDRTRESLRLLATVEQNVVGTQDRIPTIIIRSRILGANGDGAGAFHNIEKCVVELCPDRLPGSLAECDDILLNSSTTDRLRRSITLGAGTSSLLSEAIMTSLFMPEILPYQNAIALAMQSDAENTTAYKAIGLLYLSAVALFRLEARALTIDLRAAALSMLRLRPPSKDIYSRSLVLRTFLLGHLEVENSDQLERLTQALESSNAVSDRGFLLLNIAAIAMVRLMVSDDLRALEGFIEHSLLDLPNWVSDYQNSLLILCVRQMTRALRGTTRIENPATILCDRDHDSDQYLGELRARDHHFCLAIYQGFRAITLNMFGYSKEAMAIGISLMPYIGECRFSPALNAVFYHTALAIATVLRSEEQRSDRAELMDVVARIRGRIELIARSKTPVCQAWLLVLEAEIADDTSSLRLLNYAVETVQGQHFVLDEAHCLELYVNCLARMGATSAVLQLAQRCAATYEQAGAIAKAEQMLGLVVTLTGENLSEQSITSSPAITEPDVSNEELPGAKRPILRGHHTRLRTNSVHVSERVTNLFRSTGSDTPRTDDTQSWLEDLQIPTVPLPPPPPADLTRPVDARPAATATDKTQFDIGTLDVIDLHSIISSSQAMTSELQVDRLLQTLTKIIADSTAAEVCSIVIDDDDDRGWVLAASQPPDENAPHYLHTRLKDLPDAISRRVNTYVLRFREQIFIQNTKESESFANIFPNVSMMKHEVSVICVPMLHSDTLLGSLYCQAAPNTFTDRTMTLVQLLVTQISISLHNAILFKRLQKASQSNLSMIELQKDTVKRAQHSEKKARQAETKAIENLKQKEEAMKAKGMFLANVSHELRTPLNGVIGMTTIMQDTQLTAQQLDCCHNIRVCAETLVQIVNDILDYNKLEAGKMTVSNAPMNLRRTLSEVITTLRATHTKDDIHTIEELEIEKDVMVIGDSVRLQQVLMNLMSNAYKFTPKGKIIISAKIAERKHNGVLLEVTVADTGIGISKEQSRNLFKPFEQADASTARSYGGTGLGLSICKSIVESVLRGQIWLRSEPGEGTKVSFRAAFRLADADAKQATSVHHAVTSYAEVGDGLKQRKCLHIEPQSLKICIAEDNAINRKIAMSYVKKLGYKYEAYENGKLAVDAMVKSKDFHLVLMDVQMPVLDGYDATKAIRADTDEAVRNVIVIAMTASTIQGDKERCFEVGMDAYVAKPVRLETLRDAISSFVADKKHEDG